MHRTAQDIEEEALNLPIEARGRLAARLLDSLEPATADIEQEWIREAESRAADLRSGAVVGEPVGQALARIRAKLG